MPTSGVLLLHETITPGMLAGMALIYFFFLLGMQPMENTLVARLSPPAFKHSAYGAKFVLTFGIGSLAVIVAGVLEFCGAFFVGDFHKATPEIRVDTFSGVHQLLDGLFLPVTDSNTYPNCLASVRAGRSK